MTGRRLLRQRGSAVELEPAGLGEVHELSESTSVRCHAAEPPGQVVERFWILTVGDESAAFWISREPTRQGVLASVMGSNSTIPSQK
jgi:hypothetical protein